MEHCRVYCSTSALCDYFLRSLPSVSCSSPSKKILMLSGHVGANYTREFLAIGLRRKFGADFVEVPRLNLLYSDIDDADAAAAHGYGFAYAKKFPEDSCNRSHIAERIAAHEFDLILYGKVGRDEGPLGTYTSMPFFQEVMDEYTPNEIVFLYGGDGCQNLHEPANPYTHHLLQHQGFATCFVRELHMHTDKFYINHLECSVTKKVNIAHFFHECFFYALKAYIQNPMVIWILGTNLSEWELEFCKVCIKHLGIFYRYEDLGNHRTNLGIQINNDPSFQPVMDLIQTVIQTEYGLFSGPYKVLYLRDDASRRKMIGYDGSLNTLFDCIITDMSQLSFEDQVKLFMKTSHLVTIEGAHLTNIVFMNKHAKILSMTPHKNSWPSMFGTSRCIHTFHEYSLGLSDFNDTIHYTHTIQDVITTFLQ